MNTIKFLIVVSIVLLSTDLIYHQIANGDILQGNESLTVLNAKIDHLTTIKNELQEQKDSLNTLITYCFAHADRPNPIQDLIDKGFLPSEFNGKTCISIKQMISELNNQITSVQTEINNTTKKTECQYIQRENSTTVWDKICPKE
jgi:hypothetical protein